MIPTQTTPTPPSPPIELRRLHRYFGNTRAVCDVTFEVPRGAVFGYIGPNGAGKTTSMRILATLDLPTYGDALIDGLSVVNDPDRVRRRLGFMPDYFGTHPNIDCQEYLDFFARAYGLVGRARHQAVRYTMSFTGLDRLADKPIHTLSKGMKQRLCLGRAVIHNPSVLVLDEPAAGLDPRARIELREMIRRLAAEGKTILVSSHILTEMAELCDRVGIIEQGRLLATGTVAEIQQGQTPQCEVRVRVIRAHDALRQYLSQRADVQNLRADGEYVRFTYDGGREDQAQLLQQLIQAGFPVDQFATHQKSLEDVFMQVTQGTVQ